MSAFAEVHLGDMRSVTGSTPWPGFPGEPGTEMFYNQYFSVQGLNSPLRNSVQTTPMTQMPPDSALLETQGSQPNEQQLRQLEVVCTLLETDGHDAVAPQRTDCAVAVTGCPAA